MECLRCHNQDPRFFLRINNHLYCRKCIDFGLLEVGSLPPKPQLSHRVWKGEAKLEFELKPFQKEASAKALEYLKAGKDVFVYAATGAGKTEISLESICWYLSQGKKVCFAISRRQVVLEIAQRLSANFPELRVIAVCQGYTKITDADLIVCTTHQLYRYPFCFDLLILDELDAFPFVGNEVLESIAAQSCIGQRMMLSATPDQKSIEAIRQGRMGMVNLFKRPHEQPLSVPKVKVCSKPMMVLHIFQECWRYKHQNKQVLLFVPRIQDTKWMNWLFRPIFKTAIIHSKSQDKEKIMQDFHDKKRQVLICTTLLERGITVPSVQVIVYRADHPVFTSASLIQIFGRAGRSYNDPYGKTSAYIQAPSRNLDTCLKQIRYMNAVSGVENSSRNATRCRKSSKDRNRYA